MLDIGRYAASEIVARVREACSPDGADVCIEVCGVPDVIPQGLQMLRIGGRYTLAGLVNPDALVTIDANLLVKKWITLRGIHNYHPRHLIQALDFVADTGKVGFFLLQNFVSILHRHSFGRVVVDQKFGDWRRRLLGRLLAPRG